jgi:hypothetical protein
MSFLFFASLVQLYYFASFRFVSFHENDYFAKLEINKNRLCISRKNEIHVGKQILMETQSSCLPTFFFYPLPQSTLFLFHLTFSWFSRISCFEKLVSFVTLAVPRYCKNCENPSLLIRNTKSFFAASLAKISRNQISSKVPNCRSTVDRYEKAEFTTTTLYIKENKIFLIMKPRTWRWMQCIKAVQFEIKGTLYIYTVCICVH